MIMKKHWLLAACALVAAPASAQVAKPVQALLDQAAKLDAAGKTGEATAQIETAVKLAAKTGPNTGPNTETHATALAMLAEFLAGFDAKRALATAEQSAAIRTTLYGASDMRTLREQMIVALLKGINGDTKGQVAQFGDVLTAMGRAAKTADEHEEVALAQASYAMTLVQAGEETRAQREAANAARAFDGPPPILSAAASDAYLTLASLEVRWGMNDAAIAHADRAIAIGRREKGATNPDLLGPMQSRAEALLRSARYTEAGAQLREALAIADSAQPPIPSLKFRLMKSLGRYYMVTGQYALAVKVLNQSVTLIDTLEKNSSLRVTAHTDRAAALSAAGDLDGAMAATKAGLDTARAIDPASVNSGNVAIALAGRLLDAGRIDEARPLIATGSAILLKIYPEAAWERGSASIAEGDLAAAAGDDAAAGAAYRRAIAELDSGPANSIDRATATYRAGRALTRAGNVTAGWPLSRRAADQITTLVERRGRVPTATPSLTSVESAIFDSSLDVSWQRIKFE